MLFSKIFDPWNVRRDVRNFLREVFNEYLNKDMVLYDIGCGDKPFKEDLKNKVKEHIGVDLDDGFYDTNNVDIIGTAYKIPVEDGIADAVLSSQVMEHLEEPETALKEANRILKENGKLIISFPFLYPLHAAPHDFFRYTHYGMRELLQRNGFELLEIKTVGGFWYCAGFYIKLHLNNYKRGILKKMPLIEFLVSCISILILLLSIIEKFFYKIIKKDYSQNITTWAINYILVAEKK